MLWCFTIASITTSGHHPRSLLSLNLPLDRRGNQGQKKDRGLAGVLWALSERVWGVLVWGMALGKETGGEDPNGRDILTA